jgi:hypothetical protein
MKTLGSPPADPCARASGPGNPPPGSAPTPAAACASWRPRRGWPAPIAPTVLRTGDTTPARVGKSQSAVILASLTSPHPQPTCSAALASALVSTSRHSGRGPSPSSARSICEPPPIMSSTEDTTTPANVGRSQSRVVVVSVISQSSRPAWDRRPRAWRGSARPAAPRRRSASRRAGGGRCASLFRGQNRQVT